MIPTSVFFTTRLKFQEFMNVNGYSRDQVDGYLQLLDCTSQICKLFPYTDEEIKYVSRFLAFRFKAPRENVGAAFSAFSLFLDTCCPPVNGIPDEYVPDPAREIRISRR